MKGKWSLRVCELGVCAGKTRAHIHTRTVVPNINKAEQSLTAYNHDIKNQSHFNIVKRITTPRIGNPKRNHNRAWQTFTAAYTHSPPLLLILNAKFTQLAPVHDANTSCLHHTAHLPPWKQAPHSVEKGWSWKLQTPGPSSAHPTPFPSMFPPPTHTSLRPPHLRDSVNSREDHRHKEAEDERASGRLFRWLAEA